MNKYKGLDKIDDLSGLEYIESYRRVKIYADESSAIKTLLVVSRGYLVDEQLTNLKRAHQVIDHFHEE